MGRGRDKTVQLSDIRDMPPHERSALMNAVHLKRVKIKGTGVVRSAHGNVRYDNELLKGKYNEDQL